MATLITFKARKAAISEWPGMRTGKNISSTGMERATNFLGSSPKTWMTMHMKTIFTVMRTSTQMASLFHRQTRSRTSSTRSHPTSLKRPTTATKVR